MTTSGMNWERIARYLAGESSAEEAAEVRRWLDQHRSDAEVVAALQRITSGIRARPVDVAAALRKVKSRPTPPRIRAIETARRLPGWMTRTELLAAAAAVILVAGVFLLQRLPAFDRGGEITYTTGVGERDSVQLVDGSTVLLGPATRVAVRGREIDLTGEAFFRVSHDDEQPFIVRAGGSVIRDIGTEFTVQAHDVAAGIRVVVQEGIVALSGAGGTDSVMLHQGDVARVVANRIETVRGGATPDDFAWMRGELVFRDTPIPLVMADLRRWYGVEVRVADTTLLERRFTGTFTTESRERVLDVIAMALPARVERRGDTAYFRSATSDK